MLPWTTDEHGFYYCKINDSYVSEETLEETESRFVDPTDSDYQMKKGTYANTLGL